MIAAIILAHLGGFCAVALSSVYNAEGQATGRFDKKMKTFFNYNVGAYTLITHPTTLILPPYLPVIAHGHVAVHVAMR